MLFSPRFRQGAKAAIPIWIAFVPSSLAWGMAAQAHGLKLEEVVLMSALVYSGPVRLRVFAAMRVCVCLLRCGGVCGSRSTGGSESVCACSRRRIPDESTVLADEHGIGAVF